MNERSKLYFLKPVVIAVVFLFIGYFIGHQNLVFEKGFKPQIVNKEFGMPRNVNFATFWEAWNKLTAKYVGDHSDQTMVYGAIKGMVNSLGDPYSQFMLPNENKAFSEDLSGEIEGIGAEISLKGEQVVVVAPLKGSPAERAGLKPNDEILSIDNQNTAGMSLDEAISKIRGKAGTQVKLLINRTDFSQPKEFTITREVVKIKSVDWEMKGDVGYIKISQFGADTSDLAKQAADEIAKKNPRAVIIDLRNDPGGYLDAAVDVSSLFMDRGVVVKEKYKDGHIEELQTTLQNKFASKKVIVLINEGSASASEIVAGALTDSRKATLIGKKSFGKGSVQEIEDLNDGSALRVTVAKWLTPNGTAIDKEGLKPDIEVNLTSADETSGNDPQLNRALEEANK